MLQIFIFCVLFCVLAPAGVGQAAGPAEDLLRRAYSDLRARNYDGAIAGFRQALAAGAERPAIYKDLAYTLLKTGEAEEAREAFAAAARLDPSDHHAALEYAFLCFETKQQAAARRVFDRIRKEGDAESRKTAEQAFANIDGPLAEGIARWQRALELTPANFSAHLELARLAEQRGETALAAEQYESAWRLRPEFRELLLDLGRTWKALGRGGEADTALLAASRSSQGRVAEAALELLYRRYPYVGEFRKALALDSGNIELRRELGYLLLEMGWKAEAETEFAILVEQAPGDLLSAAQLGFLRLARNDRAGAMPLLEKVLQSGDEELADRVRSALGLPQTLKKSPEVPRGQVSLEAKVLAERSLQAGYLNDALKYLTIAHEADPVDFGVMLKLGWTHNLLGLDTPAVHWFDLARKSPDPSTASEADRAYRNLRPSFSRLRTTVWLFPFYSSRWRDVFSYGQAKTEVRLGRLPFRPYLSLRFIGDLRSGTQAVMPQYLSETSFIVAAGIATPSWQGISFWAEAGSALNYLSRRPDIGRAKPDYRGGLAFARGFGQMLQAESPGLFLETNADALFISRFDNDVLLYSQNRAGYTLPAAAGLQSQLYWNFNVTADAKGQWWANFAETGPGARFRWRWMPPSLVFSVNVLQGRYLAAGQRSAAQSFFDIRVGFWYAFSR